MTGGVEDGSEVNYMNLALLIVTKMSFKQIFGHHTCTSKSTFFFN